MYAYRRRSPLYITVIILEYKAFRIRSTAAHCKTCIAPGASSLLIWFIICDMIYLSTAVGLTPGGSSTVHIYTQTIHRTTQRN